MRGESEDFLLVRSELVIHAQEALVKRTAKVFLEYTKYVSCQLL